MSGSFFGSGEIDFFALGGGEERFQAIVICLGNGIELVIVATSTGHRQPHQAPRDHIDSIIDDVVSVVHESPAERQKTHCPQGLAILFQIELIGGQLFPNELIEAQIGIQCFNDIIAVGPRPGERRFLKEDIPLGVGIACDIEPVSAPFFSIRWRGQQTINQSGIRRL